MRNRARNRVINNLLDNKDAFVPFESVFDQVFKNLYPSSASELGCDFFSKSSYPKVNIIDFSTDVVIEASVPGLKKDDIEIKYNPDDNTIVISADKQEEKEVPGEFTYIVRELKKSSFKRTFYINDPMKYNIGELYAKMEEGLLKIFIPKASPEKKESINIDIK